MARSLLAFESGRAPIAHRPSCISCPGSACLLALCLHGRSAATTRRCCHLKMQGWRWRRARQPACLPPRVPHANPTDGGTAVPDTAHLSWSCRARRTRSGRQSPRGAGLGHRKDVAAVTQSACGSHSPPRTGCPPSPGPLPGPARQHRPRLPTPSPRRVAPRKHDLVPRALTHPPAFGQGRRPRRHDGHPGAARGTGGHVRAAKRRGAQVPQQRAVPAARCLCSAPEAAVLRVPDRRPGGG